MIKVLFVCMGNICRSPMAHAVFRHLALEAGLEQQIAVDSAGVGGWHAGEPPHEGTRRLLKAKAIATEGLAARQVTTADLDTFDYIIAMDRKNAEALRNLAGQRATSHIRLLTAYVDGAAQPDVPDPWYTGNFDEVYDLVDAGCRTLLARIRTEHRL